MKGKKIAFMEGVRAIELEGGDMKGNYQISNDHFDGEKICQKKVFTV